MQTPLSPVVLALAAIPISLQSTKREVQGSLTTFVHPIDQKWISPPVWPHPGHGRFYGTHSLQIGNRQIFYVGGGAYTQPGEAVPWPCSGVCDPGPGGECPLEDVMMFSVPDSEQGLRGLAGITYEGIATPCDNRHYMGGTTFHDPAWGTYCMTVTQDTDGFTFDTVLVGRSHDGLSWNWSDKKDDFVLFTTNSNPARGPVVEIPTGIQVLPDPSRLGRWRGAFSFRATPGGGGFCLIEVDWNTRGIWMIENDSGAWRRFDVGSELPFVPRIIIDEAVTDLAHVGGVYELWTVRLVPQALNPLERLPVPCPNFAIYQQNTSHSNYGTQLGYFSFDMATMSLGPKRDLVSDVRPMPSDYPLGADYPHRLNAPNGTQLLYSMSQNRTICTHVLDPVAWRSAGIECTVLQSVP